MLATAAHKRSDLCAAYPDGRPGTGPRATQQVAECDLRARLPASSGRLPRSPSWRCTRPWRAIGLASRSPFSEDSGEMEKTREAAEEMTQRAASRLGDARPASVNVHMVNGFAARELIDASRDADLVVVGWRGGGGFRPADDGLGEQPGRPSRRVSGCRPARVRADPPRKTIRTTITITPANRASDGVAPALWTNSAGHALVDHAWGQAAPMWPSPAGGGLSRA